MTVSVDKNRIEYVGNNSTTVFAYDFLLLDEDHLEVYLDDELKTISTHYTVDGVGESGGGDVTFLTAPGTDVAVTILRVAPITQEVDYQTGGKFPAETHEEALDKLTMIAQQISEQLGRQPALSVDSTFEDLTLPDPVAARILRWKADLSGLENATLVDLGAGDGSVVTSEGDLIQGGTSGVVERLAIGTSGQRLTVVAGKAAWDTDDESILKAIVDAKGDLIAGTAADTPARVAVGANRTILEADSAATPGVAWAARALGLKSMQVFTADGTWTRPTGIRKVLVEVIGAGGSGGGCATTTASGAGGGGAGGFASKLLDVSAIASATVTVGEGGAAPAAGANPGNVGEDSVWDDGVDTLTGSGGAAGPAPAASSGGAGGTATGGDVNISGSRGGPAAAAAPSLGNAGGDSQRGAGGGSPSTTGTGLGGGLYGGGGSGANNAGGSGAVAGGAGADGIVIVYEYE
jgi:hypothetical protein